MEKLEPIIIDGTPIFNAAYATENDTYWIDGGDNFKPFQEKNVRLRLRAEGLSKQIPEGEDLSPVERAMLSIQQERHVDHAGPLAGWPSGVLHIANKRILVTQPTTPLAAEDVPWPHLKKYLTQLLGEKPLPYHIGWWKWARMNLMGEHVLPGQCPIYVGKAGVGKSFLQRISTLLLGNTSSSPWGYMNGETPFNSELFYAAHLVIEDRASDRTIKSRRLFGATIKELTVNHVQRCHPKNKQAIILWPKWRLSISLNDENENLNVLPPLDDSIIDKIMLFRCQMPEFPCDLGTKEGWEKWDRIVESELPGLAHYIDTFEFGSYAAPRFGVKSWLDPVLLNQEEESAPENVLLECIRHDLPLAIDNKSVWSGKATDLERKLLGGQMPSRDQSRRVLSWPGACGTYLGRLDKKFEKGITKKTIRGINRWTINLEELNE